MPDKCPPLLDLCFSPPGGAVPYPQPIHRPDRRHSFPFLHAAFAIRASRSHTYEVLISFAAKYRQPYPCLPAFMRAVYVSREFWPGVSVGRRTTLSRVKKAAATKISLFAYLWQLFFVRSYINEFIRTLLSMC